MDGAIGAFSGEERFVDGGVLRRRPRAFGELIVGGTWIDVGLPVELVRTRMVRGAFSGFIPLARMVCDLTNFCCLPRKRALGTHLHQGVAAFGNS